MTIKVILDGKEETRDVPTSWDQVTYNQFQRLDKAEPLEVLSALWDIDKEILKRAKIKGFDQVAFMLSFVKTPVDVVTVPQKIAGYEVSKDLRFDEIGRYWDIKMIYDSFITPDNKYAPDLRKFPEIVAIAVMPNYLDAKKDEQEAFIQKMGKQPCGEVLAIANFCLTKLFLLNMNTGQNLSPTNTAKKKWRLAIQNWYRNLAITVRLWLWRRKHLSTATKS